MSFFVLFVWIDEKLLQFFTKISHKFQIWTGKTNFFLAKCCIFLGVGTYVLTLANYYIPILKQDSTIFDFFTLPILGWMWYGGAKEADENDRILFNQGKSILVPVPWILRSLSLIAFL